MLYPVSDFAATPDQAYDTCAWPVLFGGIPFYYDCRFLVFEQNCRGWWRLMVRVPELT